MFSQNAISFDSPMRERCGLQFHVEVEWGQFCDKFRAGSFTHTEAMAITKTFDDWALLHSLHQSYLVLSPIGGGGGGGQDDRIQHSY